jgi:hypothetical protein
MTMTDDITCLRRSRVRYPLRLPSLRIIRLWRLGIDIGVVLSTAIAILLGISTTAATEAPWSPLRIGDWL